MKSFSNAYLCRNKYYDMELTLDCSLMGNEALANDINANTLYVGKIGMMNQYKQKPLIMIANDDGIMSSGIKQLAKVAMRYGDVCVVAPDRSYSGMSHAITTERPLVVEEYEVIEGVRGYKVTGTPVDCIKLGIHTFVNRKPDIILSGINHGANTSSSVHYSGTMAVAREAALMGITGVGFSLVHYGEVDDWSQAEQIVERVISWVVNTPLPKGVFYNVNIPYISDVKGLKACRQTEGRWTEKPTKFVSPFGKQYYWLEGEFVNDSPQDTTTDEHYIKEGYATICPCKIDVCDYKFLSEMIFD